MQAQDFQSVSRRFSENESIPVDIRQISLSITDAGHDSFRTSVFSTKTGDVTRSRWLEAWKNPKTGLWTVDRHETVNVGTAGEECMPQESVLRNVGFFDALYHCDTFENSEDPAEVAEGDESVPYYRAAAEAAGQPFDKDSRLHPSAFGRILTQGVFDKHAYEVSKKTKGRELVTPVQNKDAGTNLLMLPVTKEAGLVGALPKGMSRLEYVCMLKGVFNAAGETNSALAGTLGYEVTQKKIGFLYSVGPDANGADTPLPLLATILTAGAFYPVYCAFRHINDRMERRSESPVVNFAKNLSTLKSLINKMPEGQEKEMFRQFAVAAGSVAKLEQAAAIYQSCKRSGNLKNIGIGQELVRAAVKEIGPDKDPGMEQAYLEDRFPGPGHFYQRMDTEFKVLEKAIQPVLNSLS